MYLETLASLYSNGDDIIQLLFGDEVIDIYGIPGVDGSGTPQEFAVRPSCASAHSHLSIHSLFPSLAASRRMAAPSAWPASPAPTASSTSPSGRS